MRFPRAEILGVAGCRVNAGSGSSTSRQKAADRIQRWL